MNLPATARSIACAAALGALLAWAAPASAQNRIYRCGNEYTNQIKGRTDCKLVEGGNVTVVRGTSPTPAPAAASGNGAKPVVTAPSSAPRVDPAVQKARDSDAKAILEQELRRAQARQADLAKEYNNGEPDKIGGEARNYQKYLDRVAELKASIARNQSDIEGIQRELKRYEP
ncbi:hypothetical protein ACFOHU_06280 [Ottowia pentelensis]|uniref:DUF4124 domain-containing protein n=1 Tax=Ottowia pentelensis TaxID=511108 RepID=A0ABV6PTS8_9BURK